MSPVGRSDGQNFSKVNERIELRNLAAAEASRNIPSPLGREKARLISLPVSRHPNVVRTLHAGHVAQLYSTNGSAAPFQKAIMKGASPNRDLSA